jgi:hypothetical protein
MRVRRILVTAYASEERERMRIVRAVVVMVAAAVAPLLLGQATYTTGFEQPDFMPGDVNGQQGWGHLPNSPTGGAIVSAPPLSPSGAGAQSLAILTQVAANLGVANNLYSPTISPAAGETGSTAGGVVEDTPQSRFEASLWYRTPTLPVISGVSDGRFAELDPSSKGDAQGDAANRYAVVRILNSTNTAAGLPRVVMRWIDHTGFVSATAATLQWGTWYRFDYVIDVVDGLAGVEEPNDRFSLKVYDVNGALLGTACGSTWEVGWKTASYGFGGGLTPRAINGFDFWSLVGPDLTVVGYIDNLFMTASSPAALQATISGGANACAGGTTTLTAGGNGAISSYVWRDATNTIVGSAPTFSAGAGTYTVTITDAFCATATSAAFDVTAYPVLTAAISGASSVCFGATTTLTANSGGGSGSISGYTWRDASNAVVGTGNTLVAGAGTYTVTVTDATCGAVTSAPVTVQTTCKATPVVSWSDPADIVYGTPLGATQLNATANVAGTFTYAPPAGTLLHAGASQPLSADFAPSDGTDYNAVNGTTVHINVLQAPTSIGIVEVFPEPSQAGAGVVVHFAVNGLVGNAGGVVTVTDGVTSCTAAPRAGSCTLTFFAAGTHTLTASYSGDADHLSSTSPAVEHEVVEAQATATVDGTATICPGGSATLGVILTGSGSWTLTWSDGLEETVTTPLHSRSVAPSQTTTYTLAAVSDANGAGSASGAAVITVDEVPAPVIATPPAAVLGQPLTLQASGGYTSYQWFHNGQPVVGVTSATLTIPSVTLADLGDYTVTATRGACTSAASAAVTLRPAELPVAYDAIIPLVGNTPGAGGACFRTVLYLSNGDDEAISGEIAFLDALLPPVAYQLAAHETRFIDDLLPASYRGMTSANVRSVNGPLPIVIAHLFNDGGALGTSGLVERAVPVADVLHTGDRASLLAPLDPAATRFNVGLRSLPDGLTVRITRRSRDGVVRAVDEKQLPPETLLQEPATAGSSDSLTFEVLAGRGVIYGAATDNGTNDPNMQLAARSSAGQFLFPVAGTTAGLFGSHFATGLQLHNPGDTPLAATLTFHRGGASGSPDDPHRTFTISPGATEGMDDVVASIGGLTGLGSLDLALSAPAVSLARVYSIAVAGQTSLTTAPIAEGDALQAGQEGVLVAPHAPQSLRFNIGLRTLAAGARLTARVRNHAGATLATVPITLPPTYFQQTSAALLLNVTFAGDETCAFTVEEGSVVIYGVWTDNITQDPALQYGVRAEGER